MIIMKKHFYACYKSVKAPPKWLVWWPILACRQPVSTKAQRSMLATVLQTKCQLTGSSWNGFCIVQSWALGHCLVVAGNWLQSSGANRVWHDIAKWSGSFSCSRSHYPISLLVINLAIYHQQSNTFLHHSWQMSSTPPAFFHFLLSIFYLTQTP